MDNGKDIKRLSRLTAILTQLQTKRLTKASELAEKFLVTKRTIYRDIKALEMAGVPILVEEGKGYSLMEGYRVSPIMFTESEAYALITAEQLILKNKDSSFVKEYSEAINKIKSVLRNNTKDKSNLLSDRVLFRINSNNNRTSHFLSTIQLAMTNFKLVKIKYQSSENKQSTERSIEPFAMYSTQENWLLIAYCRLRKDFRTFRIDRILDLFTLNEEFEPHDMTMQEYFKICKKKSIS
ncbi:helix-turn-helix transcriptional regulator [Sphingobacterium faecium]|jgi:predicted DNA-binding transcriptional regulator YafY|uniref:helix-turn-helix transcriptional regulator n=1 Tax=Sphingobacterium faecium TaxID=34087 RepID=UPI0004E5FD96|nr:YafY family protein [Sphingobacterium faecium]UXD70446.1 YafY family transcriptional regulator [Sphingobacterium faecium]WGQ14018.1 YafY family protein [Sphingobacterium faecium]CDS91558.1 putative transcriptional regulator [Sphingobacterium sp. PM2-P1-29]